MSVSKDKFFDKQSQLIERTSIALDISKEEARKKLQTGRQQSLRINTLHPEASSVQQKLAHMQCVTKPVPWMKDGLFVLEGMHSIRDSSLVEDGLVYIQNAASWLPVVALNPKTGDTVLDMCAAPGGKTSHIAQLSQNQAFISANDNSRPRLHKMQRNLERLHLSGIVYTLHDATRLSRYLEPESFDKILLDAPCSGEGMMTLDNKKDFESWSVAHIKRLQQLQKKLIVQAWQLLKPGGTLVYSTCTMAPEENEAVIDYLLRHNDDAVVEPLDSLAAQLDNRVNTVLTWNGKTYDERIKNGLRLMPSEHVEAFFVIKLTKAFEA